VINFEMRHGTDLLPALQSIYVANTSFPGVVMLVSMWKIGSHIFKKNFT